MKGEKKKRLLRFRQRRLLRFQQRRLLCSRQRRLLRSRQRRLLRPRQRQLLVHDDNDFNETKKFERVFGPTLPLGSHYIETPLPAQSKQQTTTNVQTVS